ncbi:BatD family protein [Rubritalea spongiae]|uniref:BatD family protein n=1 Tax=Rubritalea spongiae TaxID=430797 RepID=A0ABW5E5R8_9BACT
MRHIISILFILTISCFAQSSANSPVITSITSTNLIVGELAAFDITYRDTRPDKSPPEEIAIDGLPITFRTHNYQNINGERYFTYRYIISAKNPGTYTIPSLVLPHQGKSAQSLEVTITVHEQDVLDRVRAPYRDNDIICYSKLFPAKTTLYAGEATVLEYKVYLPSNSNPQRWGLPQPEDATNCTAWRFDPPSESNNIGNVVIDGAQYLAATYTTVLSALKPGKASFGPIETDLIISPATVRSQWGFMRKSVELPLPYDATEFQVIDYPETPPAEFNGAVGDFSIIARHPTKESISLNESITASVSVTGSGNLSQITAPILEDTATWKIIDVSRVEQGDERKSLNGTAEFNYILQPQRGADAFPRFTFSHFNPATKKFYIETTETGPLSVTVPTTSGNAIITAADVPAAEMNDILSPLSEIDLGSIPKTATSTIPVSIWQVIPASLLTWLLIVALKKRSNALSLQNTEKSIRLEAFKKLENAHNKEFLKDAGSFIERWYREDRPAEIDAILKQRDNQCYQPESAQGPTEDQRKDILDTLKKFILLALCFTLTISASSDAADSFEQWLQGDYKAALASYQKQLAEHPNSADLEYNVGNCYYRLNQPGKAALHFERALSIEPRHPEATRNLEFTQKMQGSILAPKLSGIELWASKFSVSFFLQITFAFLWITLLSILALKVLRVKAGKFATLLSATVIAPCIAAASFYIWFVHPQRNAANEGEAAILTQFSPVLTEPIKLSGKELEKKTLIKATPASPCRIIAERGEWSYVALENDVRGWVPNDTVEAIHR